MSLTLRTRRWVVAAILLVNKLPGILVDFSIVADFTHTWYNLDGGSYNLTKLPVCQNCNYLQNVTVPSVGCQSCMKWFSMQNCYLRMQRVMFVTDLPPACFFYIKPTGYSKLNRNQARCAHLSTQQKLLPGLQDQSWSYMTNIWVVEKRKNPIWNSNAKITHMQSTWMQVPHPLCFPLFISLNYFGL